MTQMLLAGVVGAGVFGSYHARKYAELDGVTLAGVYDPDAARAGALAGDLGVESYHDLAALLSAVHVVSVACPAARHAEVAERALAAGRHVYVEKPLATDLAAGDRLVRHAADRRLTLACGHQERVVFAAMGLLGAPETPREIRSVRRGTPTARNRDVSCVLDLMVHDLDLALNLAGDGWLHVEAQGGFDAASAEITFRGGMKARFEVSRIAERRARTMHLDYDGGNVEVDFLAPSFRNAAPFALNADFADSPAGRDPLGANIAGFLAAVRGDAARPIVTGEDGLAALALALDIERAAGLRP